MNRMTLLLLLLPYLLRALAVLLRSVYRTFFGFCSETSLR